MPPPPTPEVVRIALSPSLTSYEKAIYTCADPLPGLAVFIEEVPALREERTAFDLSITFGLPFRTSAFTYQLNVEQIYILVNSINPIKEITQQALAEIYMGNIKRWDEVDPKADFHQPIQVLNYPPDSDLGSFFSSVIYPQASSSADSLVVPTPRVMLEQVAEQPGAIGYAPSAWLGSANTVRILTTDPQPIENLRQPILVTAKEKPQGALAALLDCLQ